MFERKGRNAYAYENFSGKSKTEERFKTKTSTRNLICSAKPNKVEYICFPQCAGNIRYGDARFPRKKTLLKVPLFPRIKLCFSCLQAYHMFRNCPKAWKCSEPECKCTHNFLLPGADRIHPPRKEENKSFTAKAPVDKPTSSCSATVQGAKGFLQVNQLSVLSKSKTDNALILCDSEQPLQVFRKLGPPSELVRYKEWYHPK